MEGPHPQSETPAWLNLVAELLDRGVPGSNDTFTVFLSRAELDGAKDVCTKAARYVESTLGHRPASARVVPTTGRVNVARDFLCENEGHIDGSNYLTLVGLLNAAVDELAELKAEIAGGAYDSANYPEPASGVLTQGEKP